jgi:CheY-like chemotaxis protein
MSAHAMKEDIDRCLAAGMDSYVSKPFQIEELVKELDRVRTPRTTGQDLILMAEAVVDGDFSLSARIDPSPVQ